MMVREAQLARLEAIVVAFVQCRPAPQSEGSKVLKTGIVQRKRAQTGYPVIHGFVYHLHQGKLMELAIDLDKYQKRWDDGKESIH